MIAYGEKVIHQVCLTVQIKMDDRFKLSFLSNIVITIYFRNRFDAAVVHSVAGVDGIVASVDGIIFAASTVAAVVVIILSVVAVAVSTVAAICCCWHCSCKPTPATVRLLANFLSKQSGGFELGTAGTKV